MKEGICIKNTDYTIVIVVCCAVFVVAVGLSIWFVMLRKKKKQLELDQSYLEMTTGLRHGDNSYVPQATCTGKVEFLPAELYFGKRGAQSDVGVPLKDQMSIKNITDNDMSYRFTVPSSNGYTIEVSPQRGEIKAKDTIIVTVTVTLHCTITVNESLTFMATCLSGTDAAPRSCTHADAGFASQTRTGRRGGTSSTRSRCR